MTSWSVARARHKSRHAARRLKPLLALGRGHLRAALAGARLPPGSLRSLSDDSLHDPTLLLKHAEIHGGVFKAWLGGKLTTCIFGLGQGRRFLAENESRIRAATTDFVPLFPHGTLRQMGGDPHREYRRIFIEAFRAVPLDEHRGAIRDILDRMLRSLAAADQPIVFDDVRLLLKRGLTEILFRLVLGIDRGWRGFDELMESYERFAPNGIFVVVRPEHRAIYERMRSLLAARSEELRTGTSYRSLHGQLIAAGKADETSIGNLLQMTEAGRFDMMGLWSWLMKILGENSMVLDQVAGLSDRDACASLCQAIVMEALRLEQSEFILREATADIQFDGYFIPKRTRIRIAVWESHKDPGHFADPFRFDPQRFADGIPPAETYAPFGLDKHRCLGADWVVMLSASFVEALAAGMRCEVTGNAVAERGVFHFEPSRQLSIRVRRLGAAGVQSISASAGSKKDVDGRDKPGHDDA